MLWNQLRLNGARLFVGCVLLLLSSAHVLTNAIDTDSDAKTSSFESSDACILQDERSGFESNASGIVIEIANDTVLEEFLAWGSEKTNNSVFLLIYSSEFGTTDLEEHFVYDLIANSYPSIGFFKMDGSLYTKYYVRLLVFGLPAIVHLEDGVTSSLFYGNASNIDDVKSWVVKVADLEVVEIVDTIKVPRSQVPELRPRSFYLPSWAAYLAAVFSVTYAAFSIFIQCKKLLQWCRS